MTFVRMIVSWKRPTDDPKDVFSNTLYFNVSNPGILDPTDYQKLVDDLWTIYSIRSWTGGRQIDVRAYDMADAKPRAIKARHVETSGVSQAPDGAPQVALCLSYYADRNLPRQRGRIYLGPFSGPATRPTNTLVDQIADFSSALGGLGGVNVDWSLYSPTTGQHTRINHAWCDNSWDIIRSRKIARTYRADRTLNG